MPISYREWIAAIKQHRLLSLFAFTVVIGLTVLVILFAPRAYTSEARILLRIGRESVTIDPTASSVGDKLNLHHTRENEIQSAVGVMKSRQILERVVDELGEEVVLEGKPQGKKTESGSAWMKKISGVVGSVTGVLGNIDPVPDREKAVRALNDGVYIASTNESSVITVAYTTKSAQIAQDVVAHWVDSFIQQHADANHTDGSFEFFADQGNNLRDRLENARLQLEEAKNASNLVTVYGQQSLLEKQLAKVRDSMLDIDGELAAIRSRIDSYETILNNNEPMITTAVTAKSNEARDAMRGTLFELEVTEKNLESRYHDDHPRLIAVRQQLENAKRIVVDQTDTNDEVTQAIDPVYQQVVQSRLLAEAELQALGKKRVIMLNNQEALTKEVEQLNQTERLVRTLESEVNILEGRYAEHAVKTEQSRLNDILASERITSVNVVQPATLQMRPVSPDKALCAVAGFLAAIGLAVSLPMLLEARNVIQIGDFGAEQTAPSGSEKNEDWEFESRERMDSAHPADAAKIHQETVL